MRTIVPTTRIVGVVEDVLSLRPMCRRPTIQSANEFG